MQLRASNKIRQPEPARFAGPREMRDQWMLFQRGTHRRLKVSSEPNSVIAGSIERDPLPCEVDHVEPHAVRVDQIADPGYRVPRKFF